MKKSIVICTALMLAACSFAACTRAGEGAGYVFQLELTTADARNDPDGLWSDEDIGGIRSSGLVPKIYTARIRTPSGEWLLSQLAGLCNMQGMCDTVLARIKPGEAPTVYANPQVAQGGRAELSLNYKKLTTEEIDENGHPFKGSYTVEPPEVISLTLKLLRVLSPRRQDLFANFGLSLGLVAMTAFAGESAVAMINAGMPAECAEYASNVSSSEGNFGSTSPVVNGTTCYGAFQFCDSGTLQSYWAGSPSEFLADRSAQITAWVKLQKNEWAAAQRLGMSNMVGQQVCYRGTCATITQSSILKACQFGCQGTKSKLYRLMQSGLDCNAPGTTDGAGTSVCKYLVSGAGYNVGCITNSNDGVDCSPVGAMIRVE